LREGWSIERNEEKGMSREENNGLGDNKMKRKLQKGRMGKNLKGKELELRKMSRFGWKRWRGGGGGAEVKE
jgi:hypothetical protein